MRSEFGRATKDSALQNALAWWRPPLLRPMSAVDDAVTVPKHQAHGCQCEIGPGPSFRPLQPKRPETLDAPVPAAPRNSPVSTRAPSACDLKNVQGRYWYV
ncbi:unnamed protein product [Echinostoma caproni]|uniref:Uncharacterized protein n=1 Tax=Echinostoma caproni TaxID=27848 RepID=A0A183B639_9TREM|nr:unnamed protein product [Echinostoma caproni]